jgi:hypothetical protein
MGSIARILHNAYDTPGNYLSLYAGNEYHRYLPIELKSYELTTV